MAQPRYVPDQCQPLKVAIIRGNKVYVGDELVAIIEVPNRIPDRDTVYAGAVQWVRRNLEIRGCTIYDFNRDRN